MSEFFFRVVDGQQSDDDVKVALTDVESARDHAVSMAARFICHPKVMKNDGGAVIVEVCGVSGEPLLSVRLVFDVERMSVHAG